MANEREVHVFDAAVFRDRPLPERERIARELLRWIEGYRRVRVP